MKRSADIVPVCFCKHGPVEVPEMLLVRETPQPIKPMNLQTLRTHLSRKREIQLLAIGREIYPMKIGSKFRESEVLCGLHSLEHEF